MKLTNDYSEKIDACINSVKSLEVSPKSILERYGSISFEDSEVLKRDAFNQVLKKSLSKEVFDLFHDRCNLSWLKDRREPFEYAIDLILGWIIEDAIVTHVGRRGLDVELDGEDRYREFLTPQKISTQPDLKITNGRESRVVEVFSDWKGTWRRKGHADLRDSKWRKLRHEGALMLGIAPHNSEGFLLDFAEGDNDFVESFIPAYRKNGYTNSNIQESLVPFSVAVDRLVEIMG